jgi:rSAM/selenodomain-associated transferase 1
VPTDLLIIFVKAPRLGFVKTRLAKTLGDQASLAAYRQLVDSLLRNLSTLTDVQLRFSPDDATSEIRQWLQPSWTAVAQGDGDLGQKLKAAFAQSFAIGAQRVVIVGSDCPTVTATDIQTAWQELQDSHVVLGPAVDGGYWLIGLNQPQPPLFENISWSTDSVLAETLERARKNNLRVTLLRRLRDIDTESDWASFLAGNWIKPLTTW